MQDKIKKIKLKSALLTTIEIPLPDSRKSIKLNPGVNEISIPYAIGYGLTVEEKLNIIIEKYKWISILEEKVNPNIKKEKKEITKVKEEKVKPDVKKEKKVKEEKKQKKLVDKMNGTELKAFAKKHKINTGNTKSVDELKKKIKSKLGD